MVTNNTTYTDMWQNCLFEIRQQTSQEEFVKWFKPIVPVDFDGTTLRLRVPNKNFVDQIENNYIGVLRPLIAESFGQQTRLCYAVPKSEIPSIASESNVTSTSHSFNTQTDSAIIRNPFVIPGLKKIIIDPQGNCLLTLWETHTPPFPFLLNATLLCNCNGNFEARQLNINQRYDANFA